MLLTLHLSSVQSRVYTTEPSLASQHESQKGTTLKMVITLSIPDQFAKLFH